MKLAQHEFEMLVGFMSNLGTGALAKLRELAAGPRARAGKSDAGE
jgi:hypothetical protein